ncbi:MAG TPA: serpin family protein [Verrucomicrobiae bacterium]
MTVALGLAAGQLLAGPLLDQEKLVAADNAFAFDLLREVSQRQTNINVFLSPYSVSIALQLAANGAAGETRAEMEKVLHTQGFPATLLKQSIQGLNQQFSDRKGATLSLAAGLWYQHGLHLKSGFADDNGKFFQAELSDVDFTQPDSAKTINHWADGKTQGKATDVVQFPFPPATRMIFASAVYFKGDWAEPFARDLTTPRDFHPRDGRVKSVPMMSRQSYFVYQQTREYQAVQLSYNGGLQMEVFLPGTNSSPQKLLAAFAAPGSWKKDVQSGFSRHDGSVVLPKFRVEFNARLDGVLQALGMKRAFSREADFSGIADEPLFINQADQRSFVEVDETGTVAAAVTTVRMTSLAEHLSSPIAFVMLVDRPFVFAISDKASGTVLFAGVINDP